jgi:hypothetical protein
MQKHSILIGIALVMIIGLAGCSSPLEGIGSKPPAPKKPSLTADIASLVVDWQALDMVESYSVYCGTSQTPPSVPAQTGITGTSAIITGLSNDTMYYVWVQALNERGASPLSSEASSMTLSLQAPAAPVLRPGNGNLTVTWTEVDMTDSYNLYYSEEQTPPASPAQTGITGTRATIAGLTNGTTYYVWVQAVNSGGRSAVSSIAQRELILDAPAKPALSPGNGSITVSWDAVALADSYNLYYAGSGTWPETPSISPISGTAYTITGLTNGTTYYVWVQAVNNGGSSAVSSVSSAAPRTVPRPATGTELLNGRWTANTISDSSSSDYYYFAVTTGETYTIRWNDIYEGDGTKSAGVRVSAYWPDTTNTDIFVAATSGYTTGKSFTADKDGWVRVRVWARVWGGYDYYYSGSYAVMFKKN